MADMPEPVDPTPSGELPASGQPAPEAPAPAHPLEVPPLDDESRRAIEAVLMVAEHPVEVGILAQLVERSTQQVEDLLGGLAASYEEDGRGFVGGVLWDKAAGEGFWEDGPAEAGGR